MVQQVESSASETENVQFSETAVEKEILGISLISSIQNQLIFNICQWILQ